MTAHFDPKDYAPIAETTDYALRVSMSIAGGSGTGKTYSACLLARGLANGEPFAFIDTENKRALHYRSDFPEMRHYSLGPVIGKEMVGFPPERWIALLDQIEATGVKACVIDSFSHAWEGIGGVLEMQDAELDRLTTEAEAKAAGRYTVDPRRFGQLSWVEPKQRYRRLVERIVQAKMHVIICIRAKPVMQEGFGDKTKNSRPTKIRRADLPWDIASDRDLIFEMTASMLLVPERPGEPVMLKCPDHFRGLFSGQARVSTDVGAAMRAWADCGGTNPQTKQLLDGARAKAREGVAAFRAYYAALGKDQKAVVQTIIKELQETATKADAADSDDPFAATDHPTQEQLDAAMAAARQEAEQAAAAEMAGA